MHLNPRDYQHKVGTEPQPVIVYKRKDVEEEEVRILLDRTIQDK